MVFGEIKTVDELVVSCINQFSPSELSAIEYVCHQLSETLLRTLKSDTNVDSKYDLDIINTANKIHKTDPYYSKRSTNILYLQYRSNILAILEVYKNRTR